MPTKTKPITPEEAKAMEGTEFIYEYSDGDTIPAFVKKFDASVGLTCMTLATETTRDGYQTPPWEAEDDGTWCVMGYAFPRSSLDAALAALTIIRDTGKYRAGTTGNGVGTTRCAFL